MCGWIKLHRSLLEWEWWSDINTSRLFVYLIVKANHKPKNHRGVIVNRGQVLTGRKILARETGLSEQQIRSSLYKLKSTSEITTKATNKNTLITLVNYDLYQINDEEPTSKITSKPPHEQPTSNHKQECKNIKNNTYVDKSTSVPFDKIVVAYHEKLPELTKVRKLTEARKRNIKSRWFDDKAHQSIEWWERFFEYIRGSDFLMGRSSDWQCDLEWITKQSNFIKIIEGKYKNKER